MSTNNYYILGEPSRRAKEPNKRQQERILTPEEEAQFRHYMDHTLLSMTDIATEMHIGSQVVTRYADRFGYDTNERAQRIRMKKAFSKARGNILGRELEVEQDLANYMPQNEFTEKYDVSVKFFRLLLKERDIHWPDYKKITTTTRNNVPRPDRKQGSNSSAYSNLPETMSGDERSIYWLSHSWRRTA